MHAIRLVDAHDRWHTPGGEDGPQHHPPARPHSLLTLAQWHAVRETWPTSLAAGVVVPNTVDVEEIVPDLGRIALVALQFPKWTDGRAYSQARVLRSRHRFTGELRAVGDVVVDMLPLLARCGFDAVRLRHDQSPTRAMRALDFFAGHYQGDAVQPQPAFRRDLDAELRAADERARDAFVGEGI